MNPRTTSARTVIHGLVACRNMSFHALLGYPEAIMDMMPLLMDVYMYVLVENLCIVFIRRDEFFYSGCVSFIYYKGRQ